MATAADSDSETLSYDFEVTEPSNKRAKVDSDIKAEQTVIRCDSDDDVAPLSPADTAQPPPCPPPPVLRRQHAVCLAPGVLRRWILITLSHAEKVDIDLHTLCARLNTAFNVDKMVAATEKHVEGGHHYHIAMENSSASKHTATSRIRALFPEFPGMGCNVKFHKSWITMLSYCTKEDPNWSENIFGDYDKRRALEELHSRKSKTLNAVHIIRQHMQSGGTINALVHNDDVAPLLLRSAASTLRFAEMCQESRASAPTLETLERLADDADVVEAKSRCSPEQLRALEILAKQLSGGRRQRQRQLYCVGPSGTGKSFPFTLIAPLTRCFIPCLENGDRAFAGWSDDAYDWIFINDFHDNIKFQTLSNLLEGAPMKLNGYGRQHVKAANVPVVITANKKPQYANLDRLRVEALENRLHTVPFTTQQATAEDTDAALTARDVATVMMSFIDT